MHYLLLSTLICSLAVLSGCSSRANDDRIAADPDIFEPVYIGKPLAPRYGVVVLQEVPLAVYEGGAVQLTGGVRPMIISPSGWYDGAQSATSIQDVKAVNERLVSLDETLDTMQKRLDAHVAHFEDTEELAEAIAAEQEEIEAARKALSQRQRALDKAERRLERRGGAKPVEAEVNDQQVQSEDEAIPTPDEGNAESLDSNEEPAPESEKE